MRDYCPYCMKRIGPITFLREHLRGKCLEDKTDHGSTEHNEISRK